MRILLSVALLATLSACPTSFTGASYVAGGRAGCEQKCKKAKLRMSALVYLGEYSSACVCEVPAPDAPADAGPPPAASSNAPSASAASLGAVVGAAMNQPADPDRPPPLRW
ncbi:MAG: hypothetical protein ABW252_11445 [Polyangiales bacterium]